MVVGCLESMISLQHQQYKKYKAMQLRVPLTLFESYSAIPYNNTITVYIVSIALVSTQQDRTDDGNKFRSTRTIYSIIRKVRRICIVKFRRQ